MFTFSLLLVWLEKSGIFLWQLEVFVIFRMRVWIPIKFMICCIFLLFGFLLQHKSALVFVQLTNRHIFYRRLHSFFCTPSWNKRKKSSKRKKMYFQTKGTLQLKVNLIYSFATKKMLFTRRVKHSSGFRQIQNIVLFLFKIYYKPVVHRLRECYRLSSKRGRFSSGLEWI